MIDAFRRSGFIFATFINVFVSFASIQLITTAFNEFKLAFLSHSSVINLNAKSFGLPSASQTPSQYAKNLPASRTLSSPLAARTSNL